MSNDGFKVKKIRNENGLFEVKRLKIPVFNNETGEEIREAEQYTVCSKLFGSHNYPCYDEDTARDLCNTMNLITSDLMLNEPILPENLNLKLITVDDLYNLGDMINAKHIKLEELSTALNHELTCELNYLHKSNELKLKQDMIKEELGLSKNPTEKQVNAYIENTLSLEYDLWKIAKANTSLIRQQLDYINDRISFEKYCLRSKEGVVE